MTTNWQEKKSPLNKVIDRKEKLTHSLNTLQITFKIIKAMLFHFL